MQITDTLSAIRAVIDKQPDECEAYQDYFEAIRILGKTDKPKAYELNRWLRGVTEKAVLRLCDASKLDEAGKFFELNKKTYLYMAVDDFDSYCIYLEWNREPGKRFYQPRRKILLPLVRDMQDLADGKLDFLGVSLPPRVGKLVSDDTPVLTRHGWKNHGELSIGDEVISPGGGFVKVVHVFPKDCANIRVRFTDGTFADVHENHEWVVYNRHSHKYEIRETKTMMSDYQSGSEKGRGHRFHYQLPMKNFVRGEGKKLPVEPYTFGAWLGDGANRNPTICGDKNDRAIIEGIVSDGYMIRWHTVHATTGVEYYGIDGLRVPLQSMGFCHSRRRAEKRIPQEYLTASITQRMYLLAGLIDTDGCLRAKEHRYDFTTAEEGLKEDFISLISTFGWRCSVNEVKPHTSSSGIVGSRTYWVISFNPTCPIPCRLERKQLKEFSKPRMVAICGFENIEPKQGNCVSVEGGVYCIGKRLIPTHNSTLCIFLITWLMGKNPDAANLMSGHSDKLTDGFYREVLTILTDTQTYLWHDVFPAVQIVDNSAKNESIDLKRRKRFPTFTARSVGGTLTGAVEVGSGGCLYVDDLVEDLEESLNPDRLQAKYDAYLNQLKDRKKEGAIELMVGTRWNVIDPLGRVQEQYKDNPRYRFRVMPALNENGESNFVYDYGLGFSTDYYHDMKASIDDATWCAKYMGNPYVREGLLFPSNELRYYNGVLPDGEPYKVAVCDVAWGGGDSLSMPFAWVYGTDIYVGDVIFNRGDKTVTQPAVIGRSKQHAPHKERFEANNGGGEYADTIDDKLRKDGCHISITARKAPNNQSKLGRIIQYSPDIKKFYFIDEKNRSKEYQAFMDELTTFSQVGKNPHDDAADSLAMLADELLHGLARVEICKRFW